MKASLLFMALFPMCLGFISYDCSNPVSKSLYQLMSKPDCRMPFDAASPRSVMTGSLLQLPKYYSIPVNILEVERKKEKIYCTYYRLKTKRIKSEEFLGYSPARIPLQTMRSWVTDTTAQLSHKTVPFSLGSEITTLDTQEVDSEGFCTRYSVGIEYYIYRIKYYSAVGQVFLDAEGFPEKITIDGDKVEGSLDSTSGVLSDGSGVFWSRIHKSRCSMQLVHSGNMTRVTAGNGVVSVMIPNLGVGLKLGRSLSMCHHNMFSTNDDRLFITLESIPDVEPLNAQSWGSWSILIKASVQYSLSTGALTDMEIASKVALNQCLLEQMIQREVLYGARTSPELVGFRLTGERGSAMAVAGGLVQHVACSPVEVLFDSLPDCYDKVPVILIESNSSMFMDPVTHVLSATSSKMNCDDHQVPYFEVRGVWYRMIPHRTQIPTPQALPSSLEAMPNITLAEARGIYPSEVVESLESRWAYRSAREEAINGLMHLADKSIGDPNAYSSLGLNTVESLSSYHMISLSDTSLFIASAILVIWVGALSLGLAKLRWDQMALNKQVSSPNPLVVQQTMVAPATASRARPPATAAELRKILMEEDEF